MSVAERHLINPNSLEGQCWGAAVSELVQCERSVPWSFQLGGFTFKDTAGLHYGTLWNSRYSSPYTTLPVVDLDHAPIARAIRG